MGPLLFQVAHYQLTMPLGTRASRCYHDRFATQPGSLVLNPTRRTQGEIGASSAECVCRWLRSVCGSCLWPKGGEFLAAAIRGSNRCGSPGTCRTSPRDWPARLHL